MVRNLVIALLTLVALGGVLLAINFFVGAPARHAPGPTAIEQLPPPRDETLPSVKVAEAVEVPAGGKIMFRRFDQRTGRPTDVFLCRDWQPVPNTRNEIMVSEPELAFLLPSGMVANISGREGQLAVDRIEQSQMRPKTGWLGGDVRIVLDRETDPERPPLDARPADQVTIALDRLEFDLELGELTTHDLVRVAADAFELAGTGLHMIWNDAENRVETLTIERGEQLVLYAAAGALGLGSLTGAKEVAPQERPASAAAPESRPQRKNRPRRPTAYVCTLEGGITAEQYSGGERIGEMLADQVQLLFDMGSGAERFLDAGRGAASQPASRPDRESRDRLVVRWRGTLQLAPTAPPRAAGRARRQFTAQGTPVVLTRREAVVRCGALAYHDETGQVWLYPTTAGTVEFGMGERLAATAQTVFIDRAAHIIKLIGDVELRSQRGAAPAARPSSIRAGHWAELYIAPDTPAENGTLPAASAPAPSATQDEALFAANQLDRAVFVGDVEVKLGGPTLLAHRLDVDFRPDLGGETIEELLDTAVASGDVRLTSGDGKLRCQELRLAFDLAEDGALYPRDMYALGGVDITRDQGQVRGNEVRTELMPPPAVEPGRPRPLFVLRVLNVLGEAELTERGRHIAARGDEIVALFQGLNELTTGRVTSVGPEPALVYARPYAIRGHAIDLDYGAQTLHVDGPSRLSFRSERSLQGTRRGRPEPVVVTSREMLHIDGRENRIRFVGDVRARSADEELRGSAVTLELEDIAEPGPETSPSGVPTPGEVLGQLRALIRGESGDAPADDLFAVPGTPAERVRKEPVRLIADNALVTSETLAPGESAPLLHASISAPELRAEIRERLLMTHGLTQLLMTDRRGLDAAEVESAQTTTGLPSALISRGPSQTAIKCDGRMLYTLGADGPERRDTVVFEQGVFFVHRTGREMIDLGQMLPAAAQDPQVLSQLKSRNASLDADRLECWFTADAPAGPAGGGITDARLRLTSLLATGSVYLRDEEGSRIREVNAALVEFDRASGYIMVRGTPEIAARIYLEDRALSRSELPYVGEALVINLTDGTVRSERMAGQMSR